MFCWGLSKNGQAGLGDKDGKVIVPTQIKYDKEYGKIEDISAGGLFTAAITDKNYLISFGCGKYGRLGCGDEKDKLEVFSQLICGDKIAMISCGLWHGCVITDTGSLYMWGHHKPCNSSTHVLSPTISDLYHVIGVACGNNYTLAWTRDGSAYSWGFNHHGVLGHGDTLHQDKPKIISAFDGIRIVNMSAGYSHCVAVTADGKLYTWGQSKFGALGLGKKITNDVLIPQMVPNIENVKQASCNVGENHGHTLICSHEGIVLATGDGYKGKLGLGNQDTFMTFQIIPSEDFCGERISQVSAGGIHSSAVSEEGHVFTWGCGSDGRLGHPEAQGHRYLFRSDRPQIVESLKNKNAMKVSASYYHTVAFVK